jgi:hypothetical protein
VGLEPNKVWNTFTQMAISEWKYASGELPSRTDYSLWLTLHGIEYDFDKLTSTSYTVLMDQVAEILKDRPSWLPDCRCLDILGAFPTGNGGTVELIYTQVRKTICLQPLAFLLHLDVAVCNVALRKPCIIVNIHALLVNCQCTHKLKSGFFVYRCMHPQHWLLLGTSVL